MCALEDKPVAILRQARVGSWCDHGTGGDYLRSMKVDGVSGWLWGGSMYWDEILLECVHDLLERVWRTNLVAVWSSVKEPLGNVF